MTVIEIEAAGATLAESGLRHGAVIDVPLNRLKASPRNARKTPHGAAAVEALAASIAAKGLLQPLTVEPERDAAGAATGGFLVTIGEGRRQALLLRAKRKEIRKSEPVRCVVDLANDPFEISLDENVTRTDMHPADQYEAFRVLADERGLGAEEIAARFGVSAHVVRQRLRLGAVAPELMALYRAGDLNLDQLMAFAVSEDHARQRQVLDLLPDWNRHAVTIRRMMLEAKVSARDRRAVFVGLEAYAEAGGAILRDLFTEDGGGWLEDVVLLDRLALEKLQAEGEAIRAREGWKWMEASLDYPAANGLRRAYPVRVERTEAEQEQMAALSRAYDELVAPWETADELPAEAEAKALEAELEAFGEPWAYPSEDVARGGVFVCLNHVGALRIERGFIRPEDEAPTSEDEAEAEARGETAPAGGEASGRREDAEPEGRGPLSERLVQDLTAHRTLALRDALARRPETALVAVVHALALRTFYPGYDQPTPLDLRTGSVWLAGHAPGIDETPAGLRLAERHGAWAGRMPKAPAEAWSFVAGLPSGELLGLLAHCASLTLNAVQSAEARTSETLKLTDTFAALCDLDMAETWTATAASYFGRVTRSRIQEAVRDGAGEAEADRIAGLKKGDMAAEAERLLAESRWLPSVLRPPHAIASGVEPEGVEGKTELAA